MGDSRPATRRQATGLSWFAGGHSGVRAVMIRQRIGVVAVAVGALASAGTAGCAAAAQPTVAAVAGQFGSAVGRHDGTAACALLTDDARHDTESFGHDCPSQLATLRSPGPVRQVEVWGDTAQVRLADDTLFLLRFPDGWRVSAAGCTPRGDAPYRCEVRG